MKSRFEVEVFGKSGDVAERISCKSQSTDGCIKETADRIEDGAVFRVIQVKRDGLSYGSVSRRVLAGNGSPEAPEGSDFTKGESDADQREASVPDAEEGKRD